MLTKFVYRIDIYFSIPHLFLPILPQKDEFLSDLDNQSSLLLNSLFALASTYASFPAQQDYRTIAIGKLEATALAPMLPISTESIQYMQSLLILVYLEFGRANIPFACELMSRACQFAQKQGWNMLDSMGNPGNGSPTGSTVALRNQNSTPLSAEAQMHLRIRVIWWECWACDVVMSVTCRQPRNLHGVALNVNLPAAPALYREPACPIVWVSGPSLYCILHVSLSVGLLIAVLPTSGTGHVAPGRSHRFPGLSRRGAAAGADGTICDVRHAHRQFVSIYVGCTQFGADQLFQDDGGQSRVGRLHENHHWVR